MIGRSVAEFGRLDVTANKVGVPSSGQQVTRMPARECERALRINLTGTFFCLKHEIAELRRAENGAIVNTAPGDGLRAIPLSPM
ncbi:SDR family NAD(P)-dependent oxidoreductase [Streptomyces olivaceus]|uniref:SDR family NAD(P)-dependent oxidoreductase n=1 Tax=Streptomyces olivaceus TaxID=47716 RepID=UPI001CCCF982|nr:SDR family NAD(P)-dependent oxidoreductase [Streptomyces olivaceus]